MLPNANGKQVSFSLQNDQAEVQRYEFPEHDDFKFVPSVGHIYPGQRAEIIAEFLPAAVRALSADMGEEGGEEAEETPFEAIKHSKVPIQIQVTKIEHKGKKVGEHEVKFSSGKEIITLNHEAFDRALYSEGALTAGKWLMKKKPGLYSMRDVLNFK